MKLFKKSSKVKTDYFNIVPVEVISMILSKTRIKDITKYSVVSKKFYNAFNNSLLWKEFFEKNNYVTFYGDYKTDTWMCYSLEKLYERLKNKKSCFSTYAFSDCNNNKIISKNIQETISKTICFHSLGKLMSFPYPILLLSNLEKLDLSSNELTTIPQELGRLTNLKKLDLSNNKLIAISKELGQLTNLQILYLDNNQLTTIPKELGQLTNLQTLYLFNNQLRTIPKELGRLTNLQYLYLYNNKLTTIPKELGRLTNLQDLYLSNNQLTTIPKELGELTNLQTLDLSHNRLKSIPKELGKLTNLQKLNLSYNKLETLPEELKRLTQLSIDIRSNYDIDIPKGFENLQTYTPKSSGAGAMR